MSAASFILHELQTTREEAVRRRAEGVATITARQAAVHDRLADLADREREILSELHEHIASEDDDTAAAHGLHDELTRARQEAEVLRGQRLPALAREMAEVHYAFSRWEAAHARQALGNAQTDVDQTVAEIDELVAKLPAAITRYKQLRERRFQVSRTAGIDDAIGRHSLLVPIDTWLAERMGFVGGNYAAKGVTLTELDDEYAGPLFPSGKPSREEMAR